MESPRLEDVAREVGVHPSTVSRALDPKRSSLVNAATRVAVAEAAKKLGYRADLVARGLSSGRTSNVGVVVADLGNRLGTSMVRAFARELDEQAILPVITETRDEDDRLSMILDHMIGRRVDALVIAAARHNDTETIEAASNYVPVVVAVRPLLHSSLPQVISDDTKGGQLAAGHLADLGHTHVAQLRGPGAIASFALRARGFSETARVRNLNESAFNTQAARPVFDEGRRLMSALLESQELPTAIFAHNDQMALGALTVVRAKGLEVPRDVSIIGYNDLPGMELTSPPFTTIRYPSGDIGRETGRMVLALLGGAQKPNIMIEPTLVIRSSTRSINR